VFHSTGGASGNDDAVVGSAQKRPRVPKALSPLQNNNKDEVWRLF